MPHAVNSDFLNAPHWTGSSRRSIFFLWSHSAGPTLIDNRWAGGFRSHNPLPQCATTVKERRTTRPPRRSWLRSYGICHGEIDDLKKQRRIGNEMERCLWWWMSLCWSSGAQVKRKRGDKKRGAERWSGGHQRLVVSQLNEKMADEKMMNSTERLVQWSAFTIEMRRSSQPKTEGQLTLWERGLWITVCVCVGLSECSCLDSVCA